MIGLVLAVCFLVGLILVIHSSEYESIHKSVLGIIFILLGGIILGAWVQYEGDKKDELIEKRAVYKVKELEKGTVFTITDTVNALAPKDSIWVNMRTRQVDPNDSVAMMCVVVSKITKPNGNN